MDQNMSGETSHHSSFGSCSPFWVTNIGLSLINGATSREQQRNDWNDEKEFQERMMRLKNQHEDTKEILESAFKLRLKEQQRAYSNIQSELKLDLDLQKDELSMFIKGWPLKLSLQAVQEMRQSQEGLPTALTIVIASHDNALPKGDPMSHIYDGNLGIVDNIQRMLNEVGMPKKNILRFREGDVPTGGAALANIYAMFSNLPTVIIMPRVDRANKLLIVSVGCWSPTSRMPMQRKVFELEYNEAMMTNDAKYKIAKQKEIEAAYLSIAGTSNDTYSLTVFGESPRFAKFCIEKKLCEEFPVVGKFIKNEYRSILDSKETSLSVAGKEYDVAPIVFDDKFREKLESEIHIVLNSLS